MKEEKKTIPLSVGGKRTILLLDGNNVVWRGYHHLQNIVNSRGQNVGLELGFFNILLRLVRTYQTADIKLVWDGEMIWKKILDPTYKKKVFGSKEEEDETLGVYVRIAKLREVCRSICDTFYHRNLEADEVAGILVAGCKAYNQPVMLFSSDDDWMQLVDHLVRVIKPTKYGDEVYDIDRLVEEKGLHPNHYPWWKALGGDEGDGIRGVPRMRRDYIKEAIRGVNATFYDDWNRLLRYFEEHYPSWFPKILELEERLLLNFKLVNLRDLRLPCTGSLAKGNVEVVKDICRQLELPSLVERREWDLFEPTRDIPGFQLKFFSESEKVSSEVSKIK